MPQIKEFTATGNYRTDDKGFAAFETLGRRVGGQYDQAGNDLRDIGRAKAAVTAGIGRWPFNIIELEQRAAGQESKQSQGSAAPASFRMGGAFGGQRVNFHEVRPEKGIHNYSGVDSAGDRGSSHDRGGSSGGRGSSSDGLDQLSEGMGRLGRGLKRETALSGRDESMSGFGTSSSRDGLSALELQQRDRQDRLDALIAQKQWDTYEKNLDTYNKNILDDAKKHSPYGPYDTTSDPGSPYYSGTQVPGYADPSSQFYNPSPQGGDYGSPSPNVPTPGDYGGNTSSGWTTFADQYGAGPDEGSY